MKKRGFGWFLRIKKEYFLKMKEINISNIKLLVGVLFFVILFCNNVSSASYKQLDDLSGQDTTPNGVFFKPDGTKMYIVGTSNDDVYEYDLGLIVQGRVGIGTNNPRRLLHVKRTDEGIVLRLQDSDGTCLFNPGSGPTDFSCSSDKKLKKNIKNASSVLEEFEDIKVKDYIVKTSGKKMTGVIAQEINETHPEMVHVEDGELFVEQPNPWKLLKAIQELREMIESLISGNYSVKSKVVFNEDMVGTATVLINISDSGK